MPQALQHIRPALATRHTRVLFTPQLAQSCRAQTCKSRACQHSVQARAALVAVIVHAAQLLAVKLRLVLTTAIERTSIVHFAFHIP